MSYEKHMELLEDVEAATEGQEEAVEAALEAMSFVQSLNDLFQEQGASLPDYPDVALLESLIDAYLGELAAACMLCTDPRFAQVPNILRGMSDNMLRKLESGDEMTAVVPVVLVKGFARLADRIENTKALQRQLDEVAILPASK